MNDALKTWFRETFVEMLEYQFGPYESFTDLTSQIKEWRCFGCDAIAQTRWPTWGKPDMQHKPGCKYMELCEVMGLEFAVLTSGQIIGSDLRYK